jgi:hypothetical protein
MPSSVMIRTISYQSDQATRGVDSGKKHVARSCTTLRSLLLLKIVCTSCERTAGRKEHADDMVPARSSAGVQVAYAADGRILGLDLEVFNNAGTLSSVVIHAGCTSRCSAAADGPKPGISERFKPAVYFYTSRT